MLQWPARRDTHQCGEATRPVIDVYQNHRQARFVFAHVMPVVFLYIRIRMAADATAPLRKKPLLRRTNPTTAVPVHLWATAPHL